MSFLPQSCSSTSKLLIQFCYAISHCLYIMCGKIMGDSYIINTTNLIPLHFHYHFVEVQSLDLFQALLAYHQETLCECSFDDYCVQL
jgi:hypothetical protein